MDINFYDREALLSMPFASIVFYEKGGTDNHVSLTQKRLVDFGFNFEYYP
jgi:hypothetical protein